MSTDSERWGGLRPPHRLRLRLVPVCYQVAPAAPAAAVPVQLAAVAVDP